MDDMKRTALKRRTPLKKKSTTSVRKLKDELWQLCREITFKKHGSTCYTCGAGELTGSNRHLGHFIPSSLCSAELRYDLDNLRPCCYRCNIHLSGNWPAYEAHLIRDGINVDELKSRNVITRGMQADSLWYQRKITAYTTILAYL